MKSYRKSIKPGREGWVYLLHAEGTNRIKIGRSASPLQRYQVLKKQSPYPLKVIRCLHTVDAITDEAKLHEALAEIRVYGEWFEVKDEGVYSFSVLEGTFSSWTNCIFLKEFIQALVTLGFNSEESTNCYLYSLVELTLDKGKNNYFWKVVEKTLEAAKFFVENKEFYSPQTLTNYLEAFIEGAVAGLSLLEEV